MTPYQRLQPRFDAYNAKIVEARNKKGWSLEQLTAKSGVSYSAVSTQSSGKAQNPKLFEQAAIAEALGLSLDELMGLHGSAEANELTDRIHALELDAVRRESEIKRLTDMDAEKEKRIELLTVFKNILSGLLAFFVLAIIGYMVFDAHVLDAGLFQHDGISVFAVILAIIVIAAVGTLIYIFKDAHKK